MIQYKDITLRDRVASDVENYIRWETTEIAWQRDWDAPWEWDGNQSFDEEAYRRKWLEMQSKPRDENRIRKRFELLYQGTHVGCVVAYDIDEECNWKKEEGQLVIGIGIRESRYWNKGIGGMTYIAFIKYLFSHGYNTLYTQTWSGNIRMIRMAERVGFKPFRRDLGIRQVRGETYDRVTLKITPADLRE